MPDRLLEQIQSSLGSAYTPPRELGGGGMARVFVATDTHLGREVVVKVLSPELMVGLSAERFAREIRLAAQLQEPHIVPVLADGVTADGVPYYTMPFIPGASLRQRMGEQPLSVEDAVGVLRDVATALEYAHGRGVVHRDIKPENVLLSGRTAVVADFGIAKALQASKTQAPGGTITVVGTSLGTPAYMAPEQAVGDDVDARADLYAWGVMAYELLAGRHPFAGRATTQQLIAAHIAEMPAPLGTAAPAVPPALAALVMRCLAKSPADRPASAAELLAALDAATRTGAHTAPLPIPGRRRPTRLALGIALVAVAAAGGAGLVALRRTPSDRAATSSPDAAAGTQRLAVLPFENLGRPEDAYVADGLADEIRGKLAAVPGMIVIARASSNQYRQTTKPPEVVARELGVRYLLGGTVRSEPAAAGRAAHVRVTPELVEVTTGTAPVTRWQRPFDVTAGDVFAMQADIAEQVADTMRVTLGGRTRARLVEAPTRNPVAYDAYLRAEAIQSVAPNDLRRRLAHYTRAVALDSTFAKAWAQRAIVASLLYQNSVPTPALAGEALAAAERARTLAPDRSYGYEAMGRYYTLVTIDNARALAELQAAVRLAPTDVGVLVAIGVLQRQMGRAEDAVRSFQAAAALDPLAPRPAQAVTDALLWARRLAEARAAGSRMVALGPATDPAVVERMAMVELAAGDLAAARRVIASAPPELDHATLVAFFGNAWDLGWVLDDADQQRLLALGAAAFDGNRATWAWVLAQLHAVRGDSALARAYADTARAAYVAQLREAPNDAQLHVLYGLALATLDRGAEGIAEAERGVSLDPVERDGRVGPYLEHQLARVYTLAGQPDRAVATLERLLRLPYYLTPAWLRIDPSFAPLRGNAGFQRLVAATR
ncbi:MAG: protein kinase [Gemmatirosa sp.]|nr:protein kinase [Gemmatirosa sp.]